MKISTQELIAASPEAIWNVLMDFETYPDWNPFIRKISGAPIVGARLDVQITDMRFKPVVKIAHVGKEFRWKGTLGMPGLFDGEHSFQLKSTPNGTLFIHEEHFAGILVPFFKKKLMRDTKPGFEAMNRALKLRCEG